MRREPPEALIQLLQRLGLASGGQVRAMSGRVRRLARELPLFESVWIDTLAQARVLTPLQAVEINAGRGEALRVGPYVLWEPLPSLGYARCYIARQVQSHQTVRLAVIGCNRGEASHLLGRLESLVEKSATLPSEHLAPVTWSGSEGGLAWAASPHVPGRTASEWIVPGGRFPPEVVLEIARQMAVGLVQLEQAGLFHGDLHPAQITLTHDGGVVLPHPGLRGIVRPEEGYSHADLLPEAYDYLAPERVTDGTPPDIASDVYACGSVWWHLLTGRPPLPGGTSLAKLRAAQTAHIPDVRRLAPDTPTALAAAVSASTQRDVSLRPQSMARLAAMLGPPTRAGRLAVAKAISSPGGRSAPWAVSMRAIRKSRQTPVWVAVGAGSVAAALAIILSVLPSRVPVPVANIRAEVPQGIYQPTQRDNSQPTTSASRHVGRGEMQTGAQLADPSQNQREIVPADASSGQESPHTPGNSGGDGEDLVLVGDGPTPVGSLDLHPGQRIRGHPHRRPTLVVPPEGLVIDTEGVRFENIDFLWDRTDMASSVADQAAIVRLLASEAEFRACSFQSINRSGDRPAAVYWTYPVERSESELSLPTGRVQLSDCVFRNVATAILCRTAAAIAVESVNVLHLDGGPLIRLDHCPKLDEMVVVGLSQVTLRGAGPVLECRYDRIEDRCGRILIQADECALVPAPGSGLLSFVGADPPEPLLAALEWTGQGSLVSSEGAIARWWSLPGKVQDLDDASVSIAGLVRSDIQFAGPGESGPEASQSTHWLGPLRSSNPPGIDARTLAWPPGTSGH